MKERNLWASKRAKHLAADIHIVLDCDCDEMYIYQKLSFKMKATTLATKKSRDSTINMKMITQFPLSLSQLHAFHLQAWIFHVFLPSLSQPRLYLYIALYVSHLKREKKESLQSRRDENEPSVTQMRQKNVRRE